MRARSRTSWPLELACLLTLASAASANATSPDPAPAGSGVHVTIEEARYERRLATAARPADVSRRDYLETIERFLDRQEKPRLDSLRQPLPYPDLNYNLEGADHFAFLYRVGGDQANADLAMAFIERAHRVWSRKLTAPGVPFVPPSWDTPVRVHRIWRWLEPSPGFPESARAQLRELLVAAFPRFPMQFHYSGQFERPLDLAFIGEILLHYVPALPDAEIWKPFVERVWVDTRRFDDNAENAGNYNAIWLRELITWTNLRGAQQEVFADPGIHRLFERYMLQVFPLGSLPQYGDTMGWNVEWGHWIFIFEVAATASRDGRFRWASQRLFDYGVGHIEDLFSWSYTGTDAIESLMEAYLVADESIVPRAPEQDLAVLTRQRILPNRSALPDFLLAEGRIPAKIVFRSDSSPQSMAMMLDLTPAAHHNPPVPSNLVSLVDHGSVLLMDQGYTEREVPDHNMLWLEDYEGLPIDPDGQRVEVLGSATTGPLLYAAVRVEHYAGYPVDLERRIAFARPGAVLIVDEVRFRKSFRARLGPVFNLAVLGPEIGESWVNGYLGDSIPVRGIGRGTPVLARWKNPARDLLIRFLPVEGGEIHIVDRRPDDATNTLPYRVQYRTRVTARAGESVRFATLLLPHTPQRHPGELAQRIQVAAGGGSGALVPLEDGTALWLSVGAMESGDLVTDAEAAAVVLEGERVVSLGLAQGSRLELRGRSIVEQPTRGDVSR